MSKCRPEGTPGGGGGQELMAKGLIIQDVTERYVVLKIPYRALLEDPDFQKAFQGIVRISTTDEGSSPKR